MARERNRTARRDKRGRILRKGEGQNKDGRYYYVFTDNLGKRRRIYDTDLARLREAEGRINGDLSDGIDISAEGMTFNELFEMYMMTKDLKPSTRAQYIARWNKCVKNTIGNQKVSEIKKFNLQIFYKSLSDKGYADSTIRQIGNILIKPVIDMAVDNDIIRKNPGRGCMKEYNEKSKTKEALTIEQQTAFMDFVRGDKRYNIYEPLFTVMFSTALRQGEIFGLTWEDVDLKRGAISINHQLIYMNFGDGCRFHIQTPKTAAGCRTIPITPNCHNALIAQRKAQLSLGIQNNVEIDGRRGFVFTTTTGKPYTGGGMSAILAKIVSQYNLKETARAKREKRDPELMPRISCHTFRHTGCTRLAECHIDIKTLQEFMGHSDINVTMNVYNHVDAKRMTEEIMRVARLSNVI